MKFPFEQEIVTLSDPRNFYVITNIKAAMTKMNICDACDTLYDNSHKCGRGCFFCTATPPCMKDHSKYCATCNRWFLKDKCFQNHLMHKVRGKLMSRWIHVLQNCSFTVTSVSKHECFMRFFNIVKVAAFWSFLLRSPSET